MRKRPIGALAAGVLAANGLPHLATAAAGRTMMTPLAGRRSGPGPNLLWGATNVAAGLALVRRSARADRDWSRNVAAFSAGAAVFLVWSSVAEGVLRLNAPGRGRMRRAPRAGGSRWVPARRFSELPLRRCRTR